MKLLKAFLILIVTCISTSWVHCQSTLPTSHLSTLGGPPTFSPLQSIQSSAPVTTTYAMLESFQRISNGAQQFALDLYTKFSDVLHKNNLHRDIMISPFAVWALLLLLVEGASGNTLSQLRKTLYIDEDQQALRNAFMTVQRYLTINTTTVEVASLQALFTDINQPVQRDFESIIERYYGSALIPVDFHDVNTTYERINKEVREATRGLIPYSVLPQDLKEVHSFMMSSLFFKGQWKFPFNKSLTRTEMFYDESGKPIGNVQMMVQEANFKFAGINEIEGHVLELPYGKENRLSMLIILPRKGVTLNKVVHNLQNFGISNIFKKMDESNVGYEDEDVEVYLPKFSTSSDFSLVQILEELGITDIFEASTANLSKISNNIFVSNIVHTTKIIVDEEGTTAAAVAGSVLSNKATPPKFYLNRPFLYLIMEKSTNLLLFTGQLTNPNNFSY